MGYAEWNIIMDSRIGSVSSGLGCSPGTKGQTLKSIPFCPRSSSKLTQSIIKDHMVSHYKKVYSAKAAIDASVPKSLIHSVKYNDQIRQDRLKKEGRPQSAHSLSRRTNRHYCPSAQSRLSAQYDDSPYLYSRSSMISSPRFNTSFHARETVYQSCKPQHTCPASEIKFRSTESTLRRKQSECSLAASGDQSCYKTFQDPVQKTYSGDLLQKHSQHFTQDKPFTPKTLKSDKSSYLAQYRYYRAPRRKPTQDCSNSKSMQQDTYRRSKKNNGYTQEFDEPSQGFLTEHEWSEDEFNGTYSSPTRQQSRVNKSRDHYFFDTSSRSSPEGGKSPIMNNVSAEEEELLYLEFISAVTEDILSRGHMSSRVLDRVIKRHIDMNRHLLDEGKMRHLLGVLRKDFDEPANIPTSTTELEKKGSGLLDALLPYQEAGGRQVKTKEDNDLSPYASPIQFCDFPEYTDALSVSTPVRSPVRTISPARTNEKDEESDNQEKFTASSRLSEHVTNDIGISDDDSQNNELGTKATIKGVSGQSIELEELQRNLSESLHVSRNAEQQTNEVASGSDDEF